MSEKTIDERRIDERVRCSAQVDVSWRDRERRLHTSKARLVDVSAGGLSFLLDEQIPVNTAVQIHYSESQFAGETRYWTCDIQGWVVGVQLEQRVDWGPLVIEPPGPALPDWPVIRVRSRRRISNMVRNFLFGFGSAARAPYCMPPANRRRPG